MKTAQQTTFKKCFSCSEPADTQLSWGLNITPYCEGCADSVVHQVENDGYTVTEVAL